MAETNEIMRKLADTLILSAIGGILSLMIASAFVDLNALTGLAGTFVMIVMFYSIIIFVITMLYCLGIALDLPKSTEKNLWIIGLLFATVVVVPYFYFKRARSTRGNGAEPGERWNDEHFGAGDGSR